MKILTNARVFACASKQGGYRGRHDTAGTAVVLRDSIDDLDVLISELTELRQDLSRADLLGNDDDALWSAEAGLREVAARAEARATIVRRAIDLMSRQRGAA